MATTTYFDQYPVVIYQRPTFFANTVQIVLSNAASNYITGETVTQGTNTGLVLGYDSTGNLIVRVNAGKFSPNTTILGETSNLSSNIFSVTPATAAALTYSIQMVDLLVRFRLSDSTLSNASLFYPYQWTDQDRIDNLANDYYDDPLLHWVLFFSDNISDFYYDLPLSNDQQNEYLILKYSLLVAGANLLSLSQFQALPLVTQLQYIYTWLGSAVYVYQYSFTDQPDTVFNCDLNTYNYYTYTGANTYSAYQQAAAAQPIPVFLPDAITNTVTLLQYETTKNEKRRTVTVLDNDYAPNVVSLFKSSMNTIKAQRNALGDI